MKYVLILSLSTLLTLFNNAQAVTIDVIQQGVAHYADTVTGSAGDYFDQSFVYDSELSYEENFASPLGQGQLRNAVTGDDLTSYAWTPDANMSTDTNYVNASYIDLNFGVTVNATNGDGADIVLFFAGNANMVSGVWEEYLFSVEIGNVKQDGLTVITSDSDNIYDGLWASYALIDMSDFGFAANASAHDIRIFLGDTSMPALAAVGAYNTAVVPVPMSIVLFGSGLSLLGWIGRKKSRLNIRL